ncbi:MAG: hypothetical protein KAR83_10300 [Thermodesulfovibrionales bacterium]|nr:hypothetical protein [Thermodesulfovibrionales bacterium]
MLKIMINVLNKDESIIKEGLVKEAGASLAAMEYALLTIKGEKPKIPFNESSTEDWIVIEPPKR